MDYQLVEAAGAGDLPLVAQLLSQGANVHARDGEALVYASMYSHPEIVQYLLDNGANVNANGSVSLHMAVTHGHLEIVQLLIDHGVDVHAGNNFAIREASHNGQLEMVRLLLDHGVDLHAVYDYAIRYAYIRGNIHVFNFLLSQYKPRKDNLSFTTMIVINNFKLTKKYNKHLSTIISYTIYSKPETSKQIARYIIRNTAIDNPYLADAIYAKNYHIHQVKISNPTKQLIKQYKN